MKTLHRGWFILFLGLLTTAACLGFGRFALGAIIPFMKEGLALNYRETGWIASSIFFGYLLSTPLAGHFVIRFSSKKVVIFSLILIILGMIASANAVGFWTAYFSCFLVGFGAGGTHVPSLGITATWFAPSKRGMALGFSSSGSSFAIIISGFLIPAIISINPLEGWRISWYALAFFISLIVIINLFFLKNNPQEVGLQSIGEKSDSTSAKPQQKEDHVSYNPYMEETEENNEVIYGNKTLWIIGLIYLTWGFSYLIFSTFLVDFLMQDVGLDKNTAGNYFAIVGFASIISGFLWGSISDRVGRMYTMFIVYTIQSIILLSFTLTSHHSLILLEVVIYSFTLWAAPTVIVAFVGDFIGALKAPMAMGFITLFFGIGQFVSPIVTGYLLDIHETYSLAFIVSALVCFAGGLGSIWLHLKQSRPKKRAASNLST